jgi:hypothetical protein
MNIEQPRQIFVLCKIFGAAMERHICGERALCRFAHRLFEFAPNRDVPDPDTVIR